MACFVSLPNSVVLDVAVNIKRKGQECMDQVCRRLNIIEQDYFGLQYKGSRGENLWLNLRNRMDRQLVGPPPYRLQLKVKFFVQAHNLLQQPTKNQFYEQVKKELASQKLVMDSEDQLKYMVALITQADHGNFNERTHQLNVYKSVLENIIAPQEATPHLIHEIVDIHKCDLVDISKESAQYKLIQEASRLQNYGVEYHEANYIGETVNIGIGPTGVFIYYSNMNLIEKLEYPVITKAEHVGKQCVLKVVNDNAIEREILLKMASPSAANAMYRCITEMHSFFCCDTVHNEVSSQFSRDLKGALAAIFNENTTLGIDYVFDIKRTSREALDHARRALYQPMSTEEDIHSSDTPCGNKTTTDCDTHAYSIQQKCQVYEETLDHIMDQFTCCVCLDARINATLSPCGHMTCFECAKRLDKCPHCREKITNIQKTFLPTMQVNHNQMQASSVSLKTGSSATGSSARHKHFNKRKRNRATENMEVAEQ